MLEASDGERTMANDAIFDQIEIYHKGVRRGVIRLLMPFLACCASALALLFALLVLRRLGALDSITRPERIWVTAGIYTLLVAYPMAYTVGMYLLAWPQTRSEFKLLENYPGPISFDRNGYKAYVQALDGVVIAADIERPDLRVLADPGLNALTYEDSFGQKVILLTAGSLVSDISTEEKNAMLAHEVAHVIIGDVLRKPGPFSIEFLPDLFLVLLVAIGGFTILLPGFETARLMLAYVIAAAVVTLFIVGHSSTYTVNLRCLAWHHDDILADTLAAKMTNNPQALMRVITRARADMLRREMQDARGGLISAYLFVSPKSLSDRHIRRLTGMDINWDRPAQEPEGPCDINITERLANLDAISQGRRPSVEAWLSSD